MKHELCELLNCSAFGYAYMDFCAHLWIYYAKDGFQESVSCFLILLCDAGDSLHAVCADVAMLRRIMIKCTWKNFASNVQFFLFDKSFPKHKKLIIFKSNYCMKRGSTPQHINFLPPWRVEIFTLKNKRKPIP